MWHIKIVDGCNRRRGPLKPGTSSRSLAKLVSQALAAARAFRGRTRAEVSCIIGLWRRFVTEVRGSAELQES